MVYIFIELDEFLDSSKWPRCNDGFCGFGSNIRFERPINVDF
jgi:hypothetical protein